MECPAYAWLKTGCSRSGLGKYIPGVDPARGDQCSSLGSQSRIRCQVPKVRWPFFLIIVHSSNFLIHKCLEKPVDQFNGMALMIDAGKHRYAKQRCPFYTHRLSSICCIFPLPLFIFQADLLTASLPRSVLGNAVRVALSFSGICQRIA